MSRARPARRTARRWTLLILVIMVFGRTTLYAADGDTVSLMVGRSTVVNTGTPIARVSLTSADIADALVTSTNELLINGKMPGTISLFVWDRSGSIRRYEVNVQRDLGRLSDQLHALFPGESIAAQSNGKSIVLSGSVTHKDVIERAINVAAGYVDKKDEVVSLLQVQQGLSNQVLLRVRFAEVSRSALTELGSSFFTSPTGVKNTLVRTTTQQYSAPGYTDLQAAKDSSSFGADVKSASGKFTFSDLLNMFIFSEKYDIGAMVRALQTKGLFQSLAEPNLVAESGKEASFLAGGEIPIPIAQPSGNSIAVSVQFKEFGVRLNFTPIVNGNRVHLKVRPEVSTLDFANAVVLQGFRIPALSTRRTETEIELESGQTFAIAGLMNNTMNSSLQKIPGIGDIPILGLLFKSKAAEKNQTELVVMITPEILPNGSVGVTSKLPRLSEPFIPPLPEKKMLDLPPPAFKGPAPRPGDNNNDSDGAAQTTATTASAAQNPDEAARILQALTPKSPTVVVDGANPGSGPTTPPAGAMPLPDPKPVNRAQIEPPPHGDAKTSDADKKRADGIRRKDEEDRKRQDKLAREQARDAEAQAKRQADIDKAASDAAAKHAAEQAKKQAEIDRKQAETDKKQQKAIEEAQTKLKAAEAAYQSELAKKSSKQQ